MSGINQAGSCHCGAVAYTASGIIISNELCHCMNCSRNRGVSPVHLICVSGVDGADPISITKGEDLLAKHYSTDKLSHVFCSRCSSLIHQGPDGAPFRAITPTTFKIQDGLSCMLHESYKPTLHINYENRLFDWSDDLPKYKAFPGAGAVKLDNAGNVI
mmetsp:Transcript_2762/g.5479  ORF Transcript_2762/g.5479 Transcript_2762/m.5479 type:complete len:159 (+) Transcript_2762:95-571(+)